VFYHWTMMEEYQSNMWREVAIELRQGFIDATAALMRNPDAFEAAMVRAVLEWPNSTAVALTTPSLNYQAWIGHAGCALQLQSPEHLTRQGWRMLNSDEQDLANLAASNAITFWREQNA